MSKGKKQSERSWLTTIVAAIIGLVILSLSTALLPIKDVIEGITFGGGMLLVILCALVAFEGKKGTIQELIYFLIFWK